MRGLARVVTLGSWLSGWAGWFGPAPIPVQTPQAESLQPVAVDSAQAIPPEQDAPEAGEPLLLPDLRTLPPSDLRIVYLSGGRRELRLSNTIWNSGQGPLELGGQFNSVTSETRVHQHIPTSDGSLVEHFVGEFVWHPGHDHWHFEDFTLYELWRLKPNGGLDFLAASSDKLSYCVIDTDVVDREHPAFVPQRNYLSCGQGLQGLSPGWGDKYKSTLDGQALDLSGAPDGFYALTSTVNPGGVLLENNYGNNRAVVLLEIREGRLKVITLENIWRAGCLDQCSS